MMRSFVIAALLIAVCAVAAEEPLQLGFAPQRAMQTPAETEPGKGAPTIGTGRASKDDGEDQKGTANSDSAAKPSKIVVVVSKKNPVESLNIAELRRVFLRRKTQWPNRWTITVYERSGKSRIGRKFSKSLFKKRPEELREYWMNLQLTRGLKPPKVLRSATLVKQYLRRVKGGIGYLYEHDVDDTVKVIEIDGQDVNDAKEQG